MTDQKHQGNGNFKDSTTNRDVEFWGFPAKVLKDVLKGGWRVLGW